MKGLFATKSLNGAENTSSPLQALLGRHCRRRLLRAGLRAAVACGWASAVVGLCVSNVFGYGVLELTAGLPELCRICGSLHF